MELPRQTVYYVAILLVFTGCHSGKGSSSASSNGDISQGKNPELRMERIQMQYYGDSGPLWALTAVQAEGFTSKNLIHVEIMKVDLYKNAAPSSSLTADQGWVNTEDFQKNPKGKAVAIPEGVGLKPGDMYLSGHVVVVSSDGAKLETAWLKFNRSIDLITSTAPVTLRKPDYVTTGTGFESTSNLSSIKIFKQTVVIPEETMEGED